MKFFDRFARMYRKNRSSKWESFAFRRCQVSLLAGARCPF